MTEDWNYWNLILNLREEITKCWDNKRLGNANSMLKILNEFLVYSLFYMWTVWLGDVCVLKTFLKHVFGG